MKTETVYNYDDTAGYAKAVWATQDIQEKREIANEMIDVLAACTDAKRLQFKEKINTSAADKIDKIVSDITLVGYGLRV